MDKVIAGRVLAEILTPLLIKAWDEPTRGGRWATLYGIRAHIVEQYRRVK